MQVNRTDIKRKFDRLVARNVTFFYDQDCNLESFAKKLGINRTYASQFVNNELSMNFSQFLRNIRVQRAEQLMQKDPYRKLSTIYIECGFKNDMSFRRAYMEKHGCLPSIQLLQLQQNIAIA